MRRDNIKTELSSVIDTTSFSELETSIQEQHNLGIIEAERLAESHLLSKVALSNQTPLKVLTMSIRGHYTNILVHINSVIQSSVQLQLGSSIKDNSTEEVNKLKQKIANQEAVLKKTSPPNEPDGSVLTAKKRYNTGIFLVTIIVLSEIVYLARSLQVISGSLIGSILLGLGISVAIGIIGHFGNLYIKKHIAQPLHRIAKLGMHALVILVFVGLGILRNRFLNATQNESQDTSIWIFVTVNLLIYIAGLQIFRMVIEPAYEKLLENREYNEKLKKYNLEKAKLEDLKSQLEKEIKHTKDILMDKLKIIGAHIALEKRVNSNYHQSIGIYQNTVLTNSTTQLNKDFFVEVSDLDFFTSELPINR